MGQRTGRVSGRLSRHPANGPLAIWTVGHSNHTIDHLLDLLVGHSIDVLADVRTSPFSRYSPQFNQDLLRAALGPRGLWYLFLGAELGGRPPDLSLYDENGRVRYDAVAATDSYRTAIGRLVRGAVEHRIVLLCGEEDPISCHRRRLVGRTLGDLGFAVEHIRGDGTISSEAAIEAREAAEFPDRNQFTLAGPPPWRSQHPLKSSRAPEDEE